MRKKNGKSSSLFIILPAVLVAFFALPVIFPDIANNNSGAQMEVDEEGNEISGMGLPVVSSRNPLTKYFSKLSDFYLGNRKAFTKKSSQTSLADEELFAMLEAEDQAIAAEEASVNFAYDKDGNAIAIVPTSAGKMPDFLNVDGVNIMPNATGYFVNGKYYKNGTYPKGANSKKIEGSLAKYHRTIALKNGKVAAYVRQPDGSIAVSYMTQNDLNNIQREAAAGADGDYELYADAGRYQGARVASRSGASSNNGGSSGFDSSSGYGGGNTDAGPMGDFATRYEGINAKISAVRQQTSTQGSSTSTGSNNGSGGGNNNRPVKMDAARRFATIEPVVNDNAEPRQPSEDFDGAPVVFKAVQGRSGAVVSFAEGRVAEVFGIPSAMRTGIPKAFYADASINVLKPVSLDEVLQANEKVKIFTLNESDVEGLPESRVYSEYIREPYSDYRRQKSGGETFKEIFYDRTGVGNIARAAGIRQEIITDVETKYANLDKLRSDIREAVKEAVTKNPDLKEIRPRMLISLGADSKGNPIVATPLSYAYAYGPGSFPEILEKQAEEGNIENAYVSVSAQDLRENYIAPGTIGVTTTYNNAAYLKQNGIETVVVIPDNQLRTSNPDTIHENLTKIGREGFAPEVKRMTTAAQQKKMAEIAADMKKRQSLIDATRHSLTCTGVGCPPPTTLPTIDLKKPSVPPGIKGYQYMPPPSIQNKNFSLTGSGSGNSTRTIGSTTKKGS